MIKAYGLIHFRWIKKSKASFALVLLQKFIDLSSTKLGERQLILHGYRETPGSHLWEHNNKYPSFETCYIYIA